MSVSSRYGGIGAGLAAVLAAVLCAKSVAAQEVRWGSRGHLTVGVERATGIMVDRTRVSGDGVVANARNWTTIALFGADGRSIGAFPRVGVDVFPYDRFSVGMAGLYLWRVGTLESDQGESARQRTLILHPRAGLAHGFSDRLGIWVRTGPTWVREVDDSSGSEFKLELLELTSQADLVFSPFRSIGILVGLFADVGLAGETRVDDSFSVSTRAHSYGMTISVCAHPRIF